MTQRVLLTLPDELHGEIDERRGLIKRTTYINFLLRVALAIPEPLMKLLEQTADTPPTKEAILTILREYLKTPQFHTI